MTPLDPNGIKAPGATMSGMCLCSSCQHSTDRHGPEAGGCIECRCRVTAPSEDWEQNDGQH